MTPTSPRPTDKRTSGNPAKRAEINLTVKQQREQKRQEKLAEYQKQLARRRRGKVVGWAVGAVAVVGIVVAIIASFAFAPPPPASYTAGGEGVEIQGVETFTNETNHVEGAVDYEQTPPAGGPHNAVWLNCGIYTEPQPNENAVHSLEHGAVWVTYDADGLSDDELNALERKLPSSYVILSPYEGIDTPIALSAWNAQLKVDSADDERIGQFFEEYWRNQNAPEPNAACTGALDGPGKVS
ncbi:DUF3105 domain-containing protein [Microbacterium immunditiarum]|uniref:DUF3105 domain-containing protein n=1 Tax=Microbacterium immunditiarum TaxID=337480 RepID=A0A7Y9GMU9_9MICO|nr:DUF3105 domain-containing protein [Microbacterium immunditiarum]NYE19317.1 hypothetical protein [Microbacterium immunditiarum]